MPNAALLISAVKIEYSLSPLTPRAFHSSVNIFFTFTPRTRVSIHSSLYPFNRYSVRMRETASSGLSISWTRSYPVFANQRLKGSALGEGMD